MPMPTRWLAWASAALLSASFLVSPVTFAPPLGGAQAAAKATARVKASAQSSSGKKEPATAQPQLPPRIPFTAAEDAVAAIPGIPEARFWGDTETDFKNALPAQPGPWLILSSGGEDGAFGAGLLNGLSAAGKRPEYSVVTGVSTGALIAPFAFAGPRYDDALRDAFTKVTAADIYEAGRSGESFVDSWPLRDFIAKEITPELFADIATAHRSGRRLFVASYNLDAERPVIWNMGAIAVHGGKDALDLFRSVLLASTAIPGGFPPVLIDVEADGKRFQEMHVDGGLGGQLFVAPAPLMESTSDYLVPATELYIVVNSGLERDFKVVERFAPSILTQAVGAAVKVDTRLMLDRALIVAKRSGVPFNVATIPANFSAPSKGPFDPGYMGPLFQAGYDLGKSQSPFKTQPPPYPAQAVSPSNHIEKTGANQ
jgi:predicted acylesterase/phospholipase RssA